MVFSSLLFLFGFMPVFFAVYWTAPRRCKNLVALLFSCFFYAWGAPPSIFALLLITSAADYWVTRRIAALEGRPRAKRLWLTASITANAAILCYFKYANFFVGEFNKALESMGAAPVPWAEIALPIGISFFILHKMSCVIDVYRGVCRPADNVGDFILYIVLFPQLIAGPIIRFHDVADQLRSRTQSLELVFEGIVRFCVGLGKKVLIADAMGLVADRVFAADPSGLSSMQTWLGVLCYTFQIYFDFSGYSDMAIGLARMMGFRFLENFNRPYISQTITEFWRRWHISLSNWMREYLYIPLGGNRVSPLRCYLNLFIVFFISGLWHGASWTFVVWGLFHGFFLTLDKLGWSSVAARLPKLVNVALTFFIVVMSWVLFRADSFSHATAIYGRLFAFDGSATHVAGDLISRRAVFVFFVAAATSFMPAFEWLSRAAAEALKQLTPVRRLSLQFAGALMLYFLSTIALANSYFHPFIYFRF